MNLPDVHPCSPIPSASGPPARRIGAIQAGPAPGGGPHACKRALGRAAPRTGKGGESWDVCLDVVAGHFEQLKVTGEMQIMVSRVATNQLSRNPGR